LFVSPAAREAFARPRNGAESRSTQSAPAPLFPLAGDRVAEATARFEVALGSGAEDVRLVIAHFPFEASGWSTVPSGPAWTLVPYRAGPVALRPLGIVDRTDTKLWWAVIWKDSRTGGMHASKTRELTVVPRFANRFSLSGAVTPSATGRLTVPASAPSGGVRRPIDLASGYTLVHGGPAPTLPVALRRPAIAGPHGRGACLVQFADDSPDSARARVAAAGGEIVAPFSGNAYLVRIAAEAMSKLQKGRGEPWISTYEPAYKLSRELDLTANGSVDVTALLFADGNRDATVAALRSLGAAKVVAHGGINQMVRFELDRSKLADAAALADVQWIEPTPVYSFNNDQAQWVVQSGVPNLRPIWDHGIRGQGQVVMTADSGVRTNHEMFYDSTQAINTWGDYPTNRKIIAYKPGADSPLITFGDDVGYEYHGTHTAGTVLGNPDPYSTAPWSGMAKDAKLYFMDVAGTGGGGLQIPGDLNELFQPSYTGNAGGAARISSNSWGANGSQGAYTLNSMQVDQFVWNHPNYLIAFASGNVGVFASVQSPGTAKNCLTVGATGNGTLENTLAAFSSRGPARDGRRKPTVMAPGDIVTSSIGSTRYTYEAYSGTSMATPAVAGAMALVRQYLADGWYPTGAPVPANAFEPSAALLRAMAVAAGRNDVTGYRVPDNTIGYGRLAIDDVLYFPGDSSRTMLVDTRDGLSDQQFVEYQVQVTDPSRPLKIALCWTDAPGNPASAVQLVNDLDLLVTHNGSTYRGNYLLNYNSVAGGTRDSLNVEELVRLGAPDAGLWTVRVEGHRIMQGPQPFALCITGGVGGPTGAIAFDRFQYGLTDTLGIEVIDTNASGPVTAQVQSSSEPWPQNVTLTGSKGVFRGTMPIGPVLPQVGDGIIGVSSGDLLTVSYTDDSPAVQVVATARVNVQSATITNVHATAMGATQALVSWITDLDASSSVRLQAPGGHVSVADSSGSTTQHAVLLTGLDAASTYRYDVQSATPLGQVSVDSLDGQHHSFTTRQAGSIALLMDDSDPSVLATWTNAFAALGWDADVMPAASNDPPLVGNSAAGLRHYDAVLWQVGPENYPPFSDPQRAAIDSLLDNGGRLLVTGHDIGFGLSDAGSPSYTPEREAWIESGLKTRYYIDNYNADTLSGVAGSPVSGHYTAPQPYADWLYPDAGDNVGAAPGTNGVWSGDWTDNYIKTKNMGMHWESNTPLGTDGLGIWGGQKSRLVGLFYEWRALAGSSTANLNARTGVLQDAVSWLVGHRPPEVHITAPLPGGTVAADFVVIRYSIRADSARTIASRWVEYSLDGGDSWTPATTAVCADSGCIWDLAAALGGTPTPNSNGVMLRVRVADDGSPSLSSTSVMSGPFALARTGGDTRGPVLVAGSASCNPVPIRRARAATLFATFSDAVTGGSTVAAAEYSIGATPAPAGSGTPMSGAFVGTTVSVSAPLATAEILTGSATLWLRGRDAAGNWGAATALTVPTVGSTTVGVDEPAYVDFLAPPSPNPFRGPVTIRFGLARAGAVRLELFDVAGRQVQTLANAVLAPGPHAVRWDGRDREGSQVRGGLYFVRLTTPSRVFHTRVVALR
jgi:hypothetical protein